MADTRNLSSAPESTFYHYTTAINQQYASSHGYEFKTEMLVPRDRAAAWYKLKAIEAALIAHPVVLYIDSDAYVHTPTKRLELISPNSALTVWEDERRGNANSGVMVWRRGADATQLLSAWWAAYTGPTPLHEQDALHGGVHKQFRRIITMLPSAGFMYDQGRQAGWRCDVNGKPFVVHLWGGLKTRGYAMDILRAQQKAIARVKA